MFYSQEHQPQQPVLLPPHSLPHVASVPLSQPRIIASAQPVPAFTVIVLAGQFSAQAPHSMHRSLSVICALPEDNLNTLCGQTSSHFPQPVHFSGEKASETTFFKYLCIIYAPYLQHSLFTGGFFTDVSE